MPEKKGRGGYCDPPKEHQFPPGQSGNPDGRPKGSKNKQPSKGKMNMLMKLILSEADRLLPISEKGKRLELPTAQVILRRMINDAVKGSHRAQREFLKMVTAAEDEKGTASASMLEVMMNYRQNAYAEIERCKMMNLDPPDLVPHPDNIEIRWETGEVVITGPVNPDDQKKLEHWQSEVTAFESEIDELKGELQTEEDAAVKALIEQDIEQAKQSLKKAEQIVQSLLTQKTVSGG